jgi:tetratricopeptide (TPR) repeat protein
MIAAAAACIAIVAGMAAFLVAEPHPGRFAADRWHSFKHLPTSEATSSHFLSIGSNRYDFWRVALREFDHHPIAGIGGAGYQDEYLLHRRSNETPARAHSIELDLLAENGLVGVFLFLVAVVPLLAAAALGARRRTLSSTAALGTGVASLVHATVDWTWSFPCVVVPVFALLGVAVAGRVRETRRSRLAMRAGAVAALAAALLVFVPPWLSARLVDSALRGSGSAASDLRWAKRLDPLSTAPYLAEATLVARPDAALRPLGQAVEKQPRSSGLHYELGLAYLRAGMRAQARRELRAALALDPGDFQIARALRRAG